MESIFYNYLRKFMIKSPFNKCLKPIHYNENIYPIRDTHWDIDSWDHTPPNSPINQERPSIIEMSNLNDENE